MKKVIPHIFPCFLASLFLCPKARPKLGLSAGEVYLYIHVSPTETNKIQRKGLQQHSQQRCGNSSINAAILGTVSCIYVFVLNVQTMKREGEKNLFLNQEWKTNQIQKRHKILHNRRGTDQGKLRKKYSFTTANANLFTVLVLVPFLHHLQPFLNSFDFLLFLLERTKIPTQGPTQK